MRGALWSEIDFNDKVWRIPASRMKGENPKDHNIPLSSAAIELLKSLPQENDLVFPSAKGSSLTDATVSKVPNVLVMMLPLTALEVRLKTGRVSICNSATSLR